MNEIEAIKHFNRVIAQLKYLDGGKDGPHLKYYIRVRNAKNRRRLQASRLAVAALREQAERSKGCSHCINGSEKIFAKKERYSHASETGITYETIRVVFCPQCGKRLEVERG